MITTIRITADAYELHGARLTLRPARANLADGMQVALWRNQAEARAAFWRQDIVTPESHVRFIQAKSPYDLIWLAHGQDATQAVGMAGLVVDPQARNGEAGRFYVDRACRGQGYAVEIDRMVLAFAFDCLCLKSVWLDAWADNAAILATHKKAGWSVAGVDLAGHTQAGGAVMHMTMTAEQWGELQHDYHATLPVEEPFYMVG